MKFKNLILESFIDNNKPEFIITNESEDTIKSKYGDYERGIDTIKPGLMFMLQFTSFTDNEFITGETDKSKIKKRTDLILKNASRMPAVVLKKDKLNDGWPIYDVGFWTKSNAGEASGMIVLKGICIWRYFGGDGKNWEGIPPKWFLDMWRESDKNEKIDDSNIKVSDLFYIKDNSEVNI